MKSRKVTRLNSAHLKVVGLGLALIMMKYHLFKSKNYPDRGITVGERDDGTYFIPAASESVDPEANIFYSIEEIEKVLNDHLELIRPVE